jgi:hypothetical protein
MKSRCVCFFSHQEVVLFSTGKILVATVVLGIGLAQTEIARADGNPATDNVPALFAYSGVLEHDGRPVTGLTMTMDFKLYDGPRAVTDTPIWLETQDVELHGGRFSVLLGECEGLSTTTARCPLGDDDLGVSLAGLVENADDLYLAVVLMSDSGTPVVLQSLKRFVPAPYAHLASHAADFEVADKLSVGGAVETHAVLPRAQAWGSLGMGDSEAAIYNDHGTYKKLMVVGNSSAGNGRQVGVWDDLSVARNLAVGGAVNITGTVRAAGLDSSCPNSSRSQYGICWWVQGGYVYTHRQAASACAGMGAHLCSLAELSAIHAAGGAQCSYAWSADRSNESTAYMTILMQNFDPGCGGAGVNPSARAMTDLFSAQCCKP